MNHDESVDLTTWDVSDEKEEIGERGEKEDGIESGS